MTLNLVDQDLSKGEDVFLSSVKDAAVKYHLANLTLF